MDAQQGSRTEQLAHETDDDQDNGISQAIAHTIQERFPRAVTQGEGLQTSHQDTVRDNQTHID